MVIAQQIIICNGIFVSYMIHNCVILHFNLIYIKLSNFN